jgi:hypothetical protein
MLYLTNKMFINFGTYFPKLNIIHFIIWTKKGQQQQQQQQNLEPCNTLDRLHTLFTN